MKNTLLTFALLLTVLSTGCKKDLDKTEEEEQKQTFDGTILGRWKLVEGTGLSVPYHTNMGDYFVFHKKDIYCYRANPDPMDYNDAWRTWDGDPQTQIRYMFTNYKDTFTVVSFKPEEIVIKRFSYLNIKKDPIRLEKLSDMKCPDITGIETTTEKNVLLKGNPELLLQSEVISNMQQGRYDPYLGKLFCGTNPTDGSYVTVQRDGCPTVSYKMELGIWKKQ